MKIVLHLGAHRSASTTFQRYARAEASALQGRNIGFWGPCRTRKGLFHGIAEGGRDRDRGRVRLAAERVASCGIETLLISDENMVGTMRRNIRTAELYPDIGQRLARFGAAFGPVTRAVLQVRSLEMYWASAMAVSVSRGMGLPYPETLIDLSVRARGWRGVIEDAAAALPETELVVTTFENFAARPDRLMALATDWSDAPRDRARLWINRSPLRSELAETLAARGVPACALGPGQGRWTPFTHGQAMALRETYQDDLFWLRAGAGGLARYEEDPNGREPAIGRPSASEKRGRYDDGQDRRLAGSG
ncbi:hypothetical protein [Roseivivax sp. THAF30]|uniref:hypothetical protein n=1 Tax=Roseivivax sp. THAF30 TaxID=2587852 RepID=UPI001267D92A|nr:hypothetical protein [Roseivivax sp. THAF30]QFT63487.1 hypothetical protein FIU91_11170 [Roseivivax sp. THAF30]